MEVLKYGGMIKQFAVRDLKLRYERSALGFVWSLLNPLVMIVVYSVFFSLIVRVPVERYPVFLISALLPWNFLSRGLLSAAPIPWQNGYLLNRAPFPAESLIFSGMLSGFADFCLEMGVFVALLAIFGAPIFPAALAIPVCMLLLLLFTTGIALFFAVPFVYYRDTQYVAGILATAWLYLTPVFYPVSMVPERYAGIYALNPMMHIVESFRYPLFHGSFPPAHMLAVSAAIAVGTFAVGWLFFNRYKKDFAEVV